MYIRDRCCEVLLCLWYSLLSAWSLTTLLNWICSPLVIGLYYFTNPKDSHTDDEWFGSHTESHAHTHTTLPQINLLRRAKLRGFSNNVSIDSSCSGLALFRLMPALRHRHVGLPSLSAFLPAAKYRKEDREGRKKKKNLLVYVRRWDKTTSAVLNGPWIVTGPPSPPP